MVTPARAEVIRASSPPDLPGYWVSELIDPTPRIARPNRSCTTTRVLFDPIYGALVVNRVLHCDILTIGAVSIAFGLRRLKARQRQLLRHLRLGGVRGRM